MKEGNNIYLKHSDKRTYEVIDYNVTLVTEMYKDEQAVLYKSLETGEVFVTPHHYFYGNERRDGIRRFTRMGSELCPDPSIS